jgi:hypothetical protein
MTSRLTFANNAYLMVYMTIVRYYMQLLMHRPSMGQQAVIRRLLETDARPQTKKQQQQ